MEEHAKSFSRASVVARKRVMDVGCVFTSGTLIPNRFFNAQREKADHHSSNGNAVILQ